MNRIFLKEMVPPSGLLTGLTGLKIYSRILEQLGAVQVPQPILLDFQEASATGSFFSQVVFPIRDYARRLNQYLVLSNLNPETRLELAWLLEVNPDTFLVCETDSHDNVSNIAWIGGLDERQCGILSAISALGGADATTLSKKFKEDHIGITAWNNRLSALSDKGLLIENKSGRSKIYKPVIKEN
ncbi:MAG: hypothetical protein ABL999_12280 [Pyrinomonadaceae bacterium]